MTNVAVVTGASRNIGKAIALALAGNGYSVACVGRDLQKLQQTAAEVRALGVRAEALVADARDAARLEEVVAEVAAKFGGIDVVVNNAGYLREGFPQDITPEQFLDDLKTNVVSQYVLARASFPFLKASGRGVVVNIGSMAGQVAFPRCPSYVTSKAAIEGLTRSLALDWARDNIRVVCLGPGYVESDISSAALADDKTRDWILKRIPMRRVARPAEVADFVAFLVSDKASFATGETYYLDGGQRMAI